MVGDNPEMLPKSLRGFKMQICCFYCQNNAVLNMDCARMSILKDFMLCL